MRIIETKVYSFSELSDDAKQRAINNLSDINVYYDWWQSTYEDAKTIGLKITGFDLDRNRHANGTFELSANEVAANIISGHGETCETFKTATKFMEEWQPVFNEYMNEESEKYESRESEEALMELENQFLKSILDDYSIILNEESEYLQSKNSIIETIEANDYEFNEHGSLIKSL